MKNQIENPEENVVVEIKQVITVTPKFTKAEWESGEGAGEGSPSDGDDRRVDTK